MPLSNYAATALLFGLFDKSGGAFGQFGSAPARYLALWTSQPTRTGNASQAGEVSYTGYARKLLNVSDFGNPSNSVITNTSKITMNQCTGGTSTALYGVITNALTAGEILAYGLLAPAALVDFEFTSDDDTFYAGGHGFSNDQEVRVQGTNLPTGFDGDTKYWIVNATTDDFQLSATQGGAAITSAGDGDGRIGRDGSLAISNNITPVIEIGNLQLTLW